MMMLTMMMLTMTMIFLMMMTIVANNPDEEPCDCGIAMGMMMIKKMALIVIMTIMSLITGLRG